MLLDRRVEGLVVIANWLVTDIKLLADLTECQVPTVIAGGVFENHSVSTVSVDNEGGASMALEHLYRLGHGNCVFARAEGAFQQRATMEGNSRVCAIGGIAFGFQENPGAAGIAGSKSSFEAGTQLTANCCGKAKPFTAPDGL